jgi:hypothetical protein
MPPPPATTPGPDAAPSVGEVLALSADHLRGMHDTPRADCWRCRRRMTAEMAAAADRSDRVGLGS